MEWWTGIDLVSSKFASDERSPLEISSVIFDNSTREMYGGAGQSNSVLRRFGDFGDFECTDA